MLQGILRAKEKWYQVEMHIYNTRSTKNTIYKKKSAENGKYTGQI